MHRDFVTVAPQEMLQTAFARLQDCDCHTLPVVQDGRLLGLVTVNAGTAQTIHYSIVQRALLWLPVVALLATLAAKSVGEADLGALDAQLLSQELPPDAFIDQDFRSWLGKPQN